MQLGKMLSIRPRCAYRANRRARSICGTLVATLLAVTVAGSASAQTSLTTISPASMATDRIQLAIGLWMPRACSTVLRTAAR
jgi:hypothetical protein